MTASRSTTWRQWAGATLLLIAATTPVHAERLVASLSRHVVRITSSFVGDEITLFGSVENDAGAEPLRRTYDIVATITGPRENIVTRRKERMFGIWGNAEARAFVDVPSYLAVLSTRPFQDIADVQTLSRQEVGIASTAFPKIGPNALDDPFRQAFVRIKRERDLYIETTNGVTFLTPTLYSASIVLPAAAPVGTYGVEVKLFADGGVIARTDSAFEIDTVGFEQFVAASAADHGLIYGITTAAMALLTGWFASVLFRRD